VGTGGKSVLHGWRESLVTCGVMRDAEDMSCNVA